MKFLPSNYSRNINGIIFLDKPLGLSSNSLLQTVKGLFRANKAGHTGTLDPLATGMLPICLGEATKFSRYLLDADKHYLVTARLGERTNTSDAEGKIISIRKVKLNKKQLIRALEYFRIQKYQIPSMFSALKYQGYPLYVYARKGIEVVRKARPIQIYSLKLIYWHQMSIKLKIHCSKGTYIRTIIDDLGEYLGCGAHVTMLRRLAVAQHQVPCMITLQKLQTVAAEAPEAPETLAKLDTLLLPIASALVNMPFINLPIDIAIRIRLGQTVAITTVLQNGLVRMIEDDTQHFLGIGEIIVPGYLSPRRLIAE